MHTRVETPSPPIRRRRIRATSLEVVERDNRDDSSDQRPGHNFGHECGENGMGLMSPFESMLTAEQKVSCQKIISRMQNILIYVH